MTAFTCEGSVYHELTVETDEGRAGAALSYKQLYGKFPDVVDGDEIVGGCEGCEQPIFDGEKYHADFQGVYWHCAAHCCECVVSADIAEVSA
jgi:hypothetical protein